MSNIGCCDLVLGIIIALTLCYIFYITRDNRNFVDYYVNEKPYKVLEDKPNREEAAKILQTIDNNIIKLIKYINLKYTDEVIAKEPKPKQIVIKDIIKRLNKTYKSKNLKENFPEIPGKDVSFNVNKGADISICLRNYDNPENFHELNQIVFVSLHEVAHSCNQSFGHDSEFWYRFRFLLQNGIECGIFKNEDYNKKNVNYCSLNITYSPILDPSLDDSVYFKLDSEKV